MYPLRKKPEHLTDAEYEEIGELADGFLDLNVTADQFPTGRKILADSRELLAERVNTLAILEKNLRTWEIAASRATDLTRREELDEGSKKLRTEFIHETQEIARAEDRIAQLQRAHTASEASMQEEVIDSASALVRLAEQVRGRKRRFAE